MIAQLAVIDLVFSIDSIITAIGLADDLEVMVAAVVIAMIVMFAAARPVGAFIEEHPTTKMLALAFLLMIGLAKVLSGSISVSPMTGTAMVADATPGGKVSVPWVAA